MENDTGLIHRPNIGLLTRSIVLVLFLAAFGSWMLSNPPGAQPDDSFHFANIWCPEGVDGFACETAADGKRLIPDSLVEGSPWWNTTSVLPAKGEISDYPRLQYAVMRFFATDDVSQSIVMMRLFNVVVALILITAAFVLIGPGGRLAVALTWLTVPIAQGYTLIASNHPASWYYTGIGTLWAFLLGVVRARTRVTMSLSAALALVSSIMAIGSRPEGQLMVFLTIAATLICSVEQPARLLGLIGRRFSERRQLTKLALGFGSVTALLLFMTTTQTNFTDRVIGSAPRSFNDLRSLLDTPMIYFNAVASSIRVSEAPTLGIQSIPAASAVAFTIFLGLQNVWKTKVVALLIVIAAMSVAPQLIVVDPRGPLFSPSRYFVAFMLVFVGLALVGRRSSSERQLTSMERSLLIVLSSSAFALALHGAINPAGVINREIWDWNLNQNLKWWWSAAPAPMTVWFVGSICFITGTSVVLRSFRSSVGEMKTTTRTLVVGVSALAMIAGVTVLEATFYRPPLSARPALQDSKQVVWTFSIPFENPRLALDYSSGADVLVLELMDSQVRRTKDDVELPVMSLELLSGSWVDIAEGLVGADIRDGDTGNLNLSALADWSDWQYVSDQTPQLVVKLTELGEKTLSIPGLISDGRLLQLDLRVRVGECERRESLLKCPFVDFSGSDLSRNDLERANLRGADLRNTNLTQAKLNGTDLSGAILDGADLTEAYLVGVDLSESSQVQTRFDDAIWTR